MFQMKKISLVMLTLIAFTCLFSSAEAEKEPLWEYYSTSAISGVSISEDSRNVSGIFGTNAYLWYNTTQTPHKTLGTTDNQNFLEASLDGKIYALESLTGNKKWESVTDGPIVGSPTVVRDMIIFGSTDGKIYVSDLYSGSVLNTCDIGERVETPLMSIGDAIYFGARDYSSRSLNIKSNGNPDENWDAPYFSDRAKDGKNPQPADWSPDC